MATWLLLTLLVLFQNTAAEATACRTIISKDFYEPKPLALSEPVKKDLLSGDFFSTKNALLTQERYEEAVQVIQKALYDLQQAKILKIDRMSRETQYTINPGTTPDDLNYTPGSTQSYFLTLENDLHIKFNAIFKPQNSEYSNIGSEVAAYRIIEGTGFGFVPMTSKRIVVIDGSPIIGSIQLWVNADPMGNSYTNDTIQFIDSLIGNRDRKNNIIKGGYLVDHGDAFKFNKTILRVLPNPRDLKQLKKTNEEEYKKLLVDLSQDLQREALIRRRELIFLADHPQFNDHQPFLGLFGKPTERKKQAVSTLYNLQTPYELAEKETARILSGNSQ